MNWIKFVLLLLIITSCVKGIDVDQAENINLHPVYESSLIYFNAPANTFFINQAGDEVTEARDATVINVFDHPYVLENLIKAEFHFKLTNSVNRRFQTRIDFLNPSEDLVHSFTLNTEASTNNAEIVTNYNEVFENEQLDAIKTTNLIALTAILSPTLDGSTINDNTLGHVELISKATFYFNTGE